MLVVQCNISFCDMPVTDKLATSSHFIYKHVDCTGVIDILKISPQSPHVHKHLQLPYLLIMRPSDVSFVLSCSCSCESWPGNAWSDSSVLRGEFKRLYQLFLCALFVESRTLLVVVTLFLNHVSTTWSALYLGWDDVVALHSEMDNDPKLELASCRLDSLCDVQQFSIRMLRNVWKFIGAAQFHHQWIYWKKQSLTRALQTRQRFHGGWKIIIQLWHNRLPSSFAATTIVHPHMWPNFECLLVSIWTKMATDC